MKTAPASVRQGGTVSVVQISARNPLILKPGEIRVRYE